MLADFYPPSIGGSERHVATLSEHLVKRGHDVAVCTVKQTNTKSFEIHDDVHIYRLKSLFQRISFAYRNPSRKLHPPLKDPKVTKQLERIVKNYKPDVIHSHGWIVFSYLPSKSRLEVPLVHTLHHYGLICPRQDLFKDLTVCTQPFSLVCYTCCAKQQGLVRSFFTTTLVRGNQRGLSEVDKFIAVSNFVRDVHIKHLNIPVDKIPVTPNFYDVASGESDYENNLPYDFILYVGALMPHKGVDVLLKAFKVSDMNLPLVLIGSKHPSYDYGKYHDGKKVLVIENAYRGLVIEAYKKCKFVVIPSIWAEPCPTVALEATAYRKAIIASNIGGLPDIVVNRETGLLVAPDDPNILSEALEEMADDGKCSGMRVKARERFLKSFTAEKVVLKIEELYFKLLN